MQFKWNKGDPLCLAGPVIARARVPAAFPIEDVSGYTGAAVNKSSAMTQTGSQLWTKTQLHVTSQRRAAHSPLPSIITHHLAHAKLDTRATLRRPQTRDRRQAHTDSMYTGKGSSTQTGASRGIREFSQCLSAHRSGAKATGGRAILESRRRLPRRIQTLPDARLPGVPGAQNPPDDSGREGTLCGSRRPPTWQNVKL